MQNSNLKHSLFFLKHIFGDQLNNGLDWLKLAIEEPNKKQAILFLISDGISGKSTFLFLLNQIFKDKYYLSSYRELSACFNSNYNDKIIIAFDETDILSNNIEKKISSLAMSDTITINEQMKKPFDTDFNSKIVLTCNDPAAFPSRHEYLFLTIYVPKIEKEDISLRFKLSQETPYLVKFLKNRELTTQNK